MRVTFEELSDIHVEKMVVAECEDHHVGEVAGYRCQECHEADESLGQIWHDADCPLAGQHGRQHYDELSADVIVGQSPELHPENPIWVIEAAETDPEDGVFNGTVVGFKCHCGNADDDWYEVVHDEACDLSDCSGSGPPTTAQPPLAADGGPER